MSLHGNIPVVLSMSGSPNSDIDNEKIGTLSVPVGSLQRNYKTCPRILLYCLG